MSEIDCVGTRELVCPYCGHVHGTKLRRQEDNFLCGGCGQRFRYDTEQVRYFTSERVDCLNDETLHEWQRIHGTMPIGVTEQWGCRRCRERKYQSGQIRPGATTGKVCGLYL